MDCIWDETIDIFYTVFFGQRLPFSKRTELNARNTFLFVLNEEFFSDINRKESNSLMLLSARDIWGSGGICEVEVRL